MSLVWINSILRGYCTIHTYSLHQS